MTNSAAADKETDGACKFIESFAESAMPELENFLRPFSNEHNPSMARIDLIKANLGYILGYLRQPGAISPEDKARIANALGTIVEMLFMMEHDVPYTQALHEHKAKSAGAAHARDGKVQRSLIDQRIRSLAIEARRKPSNSNVTQNRIGQLIAPEFNAWLEERRLSGESAFKNAKTLKGPSIGKRLRELEKSDG